VVDSQKGGTYRTKKEGREGRNSWKHSPVFKKRSSDRKSGRRLSPGGKGTSSGIGERGNVSGGDGGSSEES